MVRKKQKKISELDSYKNILKELLESAKKDKKFLLDAQKKLAEDVNKISYQLMKNEGAVAILEKILGNK